MPDDPKSVWISRQIPRIWSHYYETAQGIEWLIFYESYSMTHHTKLYPCDLNRGKWSYHLIWNFGVKNFQITNFRLNNIFSTIFYGFYGFTARIFDILWLLLKCWEMRWFHSNKAFSQYTDEYRANGKYDSSLLTHDGVTMTSFLNNHLREQESHESARIFRAWSISRVFIIHYRDKWIRFIIVTTFWLFQTLERNFWSRHNSQKSVCLAKIICQAVW